MVQLLNQEMADLFDLNSQVKQAHWNVKGPHFIALHKLFDKTSAALVAAIDTVAERAVQLGGTALGTVHLVAEHSRLPEYPIDITDGLEHVQAVSTAMAQCAKSVRAAIDAAEDCDDIGTSDLFTEVSRMLDMQLWMIDAHRR